jgi:hypothetical protein
MREYSQRENKAPYILNLLYVSKNFRYPLNTKRAARMFLNRLFKSEVVRRGEEWRGESQFPPEL